MLGLDNWSLILLLRRNSSFSGWRSLFLRRNMLLFRNRRLNLMKFLFRLWNRFYEGLNTLFLSSGYLKSILFGWWNRLLLLSYRRNLFLLSNFNFFVFKLNKNLFLANVRTRLFWLNLGRIFDNFLYFMWNFCFLSNWRNRFRRLHKVGNLLIVNWLDRSFYLFFNYWIIFYTNFIWRNWKGKGILIIFMFWFEVRFLVRRLDFRHWLQFFNAFSHFNVVYLVKNFFWRYLLDL